MTTAAAGARDAMTTDAALEIAVAAARAGGRVALSRLGHPGYLSWKGHRDVVCEASLLVQEAIVSSLSAGFPDSEVLAEEGPEDAPMPVDATHLWIVDPICGSLNFVQGLPHFGIAIALRSAGSIRVGVVYDPCRDELFTAATRHVGQAQRAADQRPADLGWIGGLGRRHRRDRLATQRRPSPAGQVDRRCDGRSGARLQPDGLARARRSAGWRPVASTPTGIST